MSKQGQAVQPKSLKRMALARPNGPREQSPGLKALRPMPWDKWDPRCGLTGPRELCSPEEIARAAVLSTVGSAQSRFSRPGRPHGCGGLFPRASA